MDESRAVVVVGGTGLVGGEILKLLRQTYPQVRLMVASRSLERAQQAAGPLGAEPLVVDVAKPRPLGALTQPPLAVINAVNDPEDLLLLNAVEAQVPLVDVTRWTTRVRDSLVRLAHRPPSSPVMLASGWMGGMASLAAAAVSQRGPSAQRLDISITYDLQDRSGPDSVEFMDRLGTTFEVMQQGARTAVEPLGPGHAVQFPDGVVRRTYPLDTPEQMTIPLLLGIPSVATRIAFNSRAATLSLVWLARLGVFRWLRHPRFTPLRRALLGSGGKGGRASFVVEAEGRRLSVVDPLGQAHLTAVGAVMALQRLLGWDGAPAAKGVVFPEQHPNPQDALQRASQLGVLLQWN